MKLKVTLESLDDKVRALQYSSTNKKLFIGCKELTIFQFINQQTYKIKNIEEEGSIYSLFINNNLNNNELFIGRHSGSLQLFDLQQEKYIFNLQNYHDNTIRCFYEDYNILFTGSYDYKVKLFDKRKNKEMKLENDICHSGYVNSIFVKDNSIYTASIDGISIFNLQNGKLLQKIKQKSEVLSFINLENNLTFCCKDGSVKIFDLNCNQVIHTLFSYNNCINYSMNCIDNTIENTFSGNSNGEIFNFNNENLFQQEEPLQIKDKSSIRSICCLQSGNNSSKQIRYLAIGTQSKSVQVYSYNTI
ncbi:hypothetical protein ABK040_002899 [Willaertia magna]